MRTLFRRRTPRSIALATSLVVLVALSLLTQASETMAGFDARVTNSSNTAGTASYFSCEDAYTANRGNALFAYRFDNSGTSVVTPGFATYEAEGATISGGTYVAASTLGYSGTGYVVDEGSTAFTVSAPASGAYTIALRYGVISTTGPTRTLSLQIDAGSPVQVTLPALTTSDHWSSVYLSTTLTAGSHSVTLSKAANTVTLDHLKIIQQSASVSRDTVTGTSGATLQSRSADVGGSWVRRNLSGSDDDAVVSADGNIRKSNPSTYGALYTTSAAPASADYRVSADIDTLTNINEDQAGVVGRLDPANPNGTYYLAGYQQARGAFVLFRVTSNSWTLLGEWAAVSSANQHTNRISLDMNGTRIRLLVDGAERVAVTDTGITAPGLAGVFSGLSPSQARTTITGTTGMHLDNFEATQLTEFDRAAASDFSPRRSDGNYHGARAAHPHPTISGCPRDSGTAYGLDGKTSYVSNPNSWTATNTFTVELWFRTKVAGGRLIGLSNAATGSSTMDDRVLYMTDAGQLVFGVYNGGVRTIMSTGTKNYADDNWHHVAATLSPAGMLLYIDGTSANSTSDPATTAARPFTGYWRIGFDTVSTQWPSLPANAYFTGSMRFAAVHTDALSANQITDHHASGQ